MTYNLITLNVRGIRNPKKRKSMFNWLNRHNSHIVFLPVDAWSKEWGGTFFANHGSNHSRGILIGIKNTIDLKSVKVYDDSKGRLLGVKISVNDSLYYLWNIYAPNDVNDRKHFLGNMIDVINDNSTDGHIIIGGDLNTVLNPELDKIGGTKPNPACANIINDYIVKQELVDIWRVKHGQDKRYTWKQNKPHILCALDYWFIPSIFDAATDFVKILTVPRTDHLAVHLRMSFESDNKGPNYWKFNNKWLSNEKFVSDILLMIDECIHTYNESLSRAELWTLCTNYIRSFSMDFARGSEFSKKCIFSDIEQKLQEAYVNIAKYPNDDMSKVNFNNLKFQYEILNEHFMKGIQIRSKEKWIEEGEKSTKYFLNLEKSKVYRKSVTKLQDSNGKLITDSDKILNEEINFFSKLYKSQGTASVNTYNDFFMNVNTPTLNEADQELCNGSITVDECFKALTGMANNKSPGYDGITVEFYRKLWNKVGPIVTDAFNESYNDGALTRI